MGRHRDDFFAAGILVNDRDMPKLPACFVNLAGIVGGIHQVELFFKWIKQHLRINNFFGTSENAVKSQIWIAVSVYVLVAIMKKQLNLQESLYTILQILIVSVFEKIPIYQLVTDRDYKIEDVAVCNQLKIFDY